MVHFSSSGNDPIQWERNDQPQVVLAQLSQATSTMHHIDEVFLWLVHTIVSRFDVQVAQVWTTQATTAGQTSSQLRSVMCKDHSLPQNLVVNTYIADLVGHILDEQRDAQLKSVDVISSPHHSMLLKRHGLYYFTGAFVCGDVLVPPPRESTSMSMQKIPTPLAMVLLLFFRHMPHQYLLPAVGSILTQALPIASSCGFLLSAPVHGYPTSPHTEPISHTQSSRMEPVPPTPSSRSDPSKLIARRVEDPMSNPISAAMALPEVQMRHVYKVINDRRSVAQLSRLINLEQRDVLLILQKLVAMQRVQMYEPTGRRVEDVRFLEEL